MCYIRQKPANPHHYNFQNMNSSMMIMAIKLTVSLKHQYQYCPGWGHVWKLYQQQVCCCACEYIIKQFTQSFLMHFLLFHNQIGLFQNLYFNVQLFMLTNPHPSDWQQIRPEGSPLSIRRWQRGLFHWFFCMSSHCLS